MTPKEKILELFTELSTVDRVIVLQKLNTIDTKEIKTSEESPPLYCPECESRLIVKNGKRGNLQKYKCKSCLKVFTSRTGTPLHKLQKPDKFEAYKTIMLENYLPLKQMASKIGISIQTAFDWRNKIL